MSRYMINPVDRCIDCGYHGDRSEWNQRQVEANRPELVKLPDHVCYKNSRLGTPIQSKDIEIFPDFCDLITDEQLKGMDL